MPLTDTLEQWYIKALTGMNNLVEDLDLKDKWVDIARNCRFEEEPGAVDKRSPVTYYNSTTMGSGSVGVTGIIRYYTSGGVTKFISIHDTTAYAGDDSDGTWDAIRTSLTTGKRTTFVVYKDLLIAGNGFDNPWVYDGASDNVTWELGSCKGLVSTGSTGALEASQVYSYQVGITVSGAEYICGAISNAVNSGTAQCIELTEVPLGPAGTTNRKIYRIEGDETVTTHGNYDLVATISDNTTVAYTDTTADASLGATVAAVSDDMPLGSMLVIHRERMFVSGDPSNPNSIYYSDPYTPHVIQHTTNLSVMKVSEEDGDEIMGIPIQLGTMLCIKKNTIRKLHITSATSGADPTTWFAEDPSSWNGSPAQWSITQTPFGVVYLGWDHWYVFDGSTSRPIIDEFDTKDVLDGRYSDTVGHYHKGIMLAAYTDKAAANQFHDRVMRYNFKRKALSYDEWTSTTISGPNCFTSKSGDDETGELYYGDSQLGYVVKDKESEQATLLKTKTEANEGTLSNIFVGGTENNPYLEIGSVTSAGNIPDDIIIFWDQEAASPGSGWTEITSTYDGYFIKVASTSATTAAASSHTHSVSGTLSYFDPADVNSGPGDHATQGSKSGHSHGWSGTSTSVSTEPRHIKLRMFKSASATTTEFPDGAIIMWDSATPPTGFSSLSNVGYYIKAGSTSLDTPVASSHGHTVSATSDAFGSPDLADNSQATIAGPVSHSHSVSATLASSSLDSWELAYAQIHMIKKVGEADTWDGSDQFCYALVEGSSTPTGWTAVSDYNDMYLKVGASSTSTGAASGASHTHTVSSGTSGSSSPQTGSTGSQTQNNDNHTHPFSGTAVAKDAGAPKTVTFRLFKFVLGKMKDYNAAIASAETAGTFTAPSQQINAESLGEFLWNETKVTGDDIVINTRVGATQAAAEAAGWDATDLSDPNGSTIQSTANIWIQYRIVFSAVSTTVANPRVYFTNGYMVKYTYRAGATDAETSVNWMYSIGFRNFDKPGIDKIFKNITSVHEGAVGSATIEWETEHTSTSNQFVIDLTTYPKRWRSFFPSTAMGEEINITVFKNDLNDFRLREIKGFYSPQPLLT